MNAQDILGSLFLVGKRAAALRVLLDDVADGLCADERAYFDRKLSAFEARNAELMTRVFPPSEH